MIRGIQAAVSIVIVLCAITQSRADVNSDFADANKFYQQGKFTEAAKVYGGLAQALGSAPEVWFNLGNAELKDGHEGRAIAAYRQAALLSPRDADLHANLQYARSLVTDSVTLRPGPLARALAFLTPAEWTALVALSAGTLLALLALREWRGNLRNTLAAPTKLAALATVLFVIGKFADASLAAQPAAVVVQAEAAVRAGPLEDAQTLFSLKDGIELLVTDTRDGWLQVRDAQHRIGWVKRDAAQLVGL